MSLCPLCFSLSFTVSRRRRRTIDREYKTDATAETTIERHACYSHAIRSKLHFGRSPTSSCFFKRSFFLLFSILRVNIELQTMRYRPSGLFDKSHGGITIDDEMHVFHRCENRFEFGLSSIIVLERCSEYLYSRVAPGRAGGDAIEIICLILYWRECVTATNMFLV